MAKKILIISASPKPAGNTETLVGWFREAACACGAEVEIVHAALLGYKALGCTSCRACQKRKAYGCVIPDEASRVLAKMAAADVIVMATPLYFFGPSAQLKLIFDRMFSLYKWDNRAGTMKTILANKQLVLLASAYEDQGLDALRKPFALTAAYSGMRFKSLVVANAGVSGSLKAKPGVRRKVMALARSVAA